MLWSCLNHKIKNCNPVDDDKIIQFILNLDKSSKTMLLLGCLPLPFDSLTVSVIIRFIASLVKFTEYEKINCECWRPMAFFVILIVAFSFLCMQIFYYCILTCILTYICKSTSCVNK